MTVILPQKNLVHIFCAVCYPNRTKVA